MTKKQFKTQDWYPKSVPKKRKVIDSKCIKPRSSGSLRAGDYIKKNSGKVWAKIEISSAHPNKHDKIKIERKGIGGPDSFLPIYEISNPFDSDIFVYTYIKNE